MPAPGAVGVGGMIQVEGLRDVDRALGEIDKEVRLGLRTELRKAAQPVRVRAAYLGYTQISGMKRHVNSAWWTMRLGGGMYVYLAPASRNKGGSPRPNLAGLLMTKAMRPGLAQMAPTITADIEAAIDRAITSVGF